MDRGVSEYAQSDQSSVATYTPQPDPRSANLSSNNTPQSDYGVTPTPIHSSGYPPDHLARYGQYPHASHHPPGAVATMAQPTNPSISQASPTYPQQYSPYPPQGEIPYPPHQTPHGMYRPPPEWPPYGQHPGMPAPYHPGTSQPPPQNAQNRGQVYSFVPIPGAQQHKRPRRRYEEIERMYKCGWNGCEKAYGTLNHLNAHVTMQSHGQKRTPEEFKEIRKEWKARKKEEENARKQEDERARASAQAGQVDGQPGEGQPVQGQPYQPNGRPSLPPIAYGGPNDQGHPQGQYGQHQGGMVYAQGNGQVYQPPNYPNSPYGPPGQQVYQQPTGAAHY